MITSAGAAADLAWATPYTGPAFTCAATAPTVANLGDRWFDQTNSVLFTYVTDGSSNFWFGGV